MLIALDIVVAQLKAQIVDVLAVIFVLVHVVTDAVDVAGLALTVVILVVKLAAL